MSAMAQAGAPAESSRHASNRRGMTAAASGAMTAVRAVLGAIAARAVIRPIRTEAIRHPAAGRDGPLVVLRLPPAMGRGRTCSLAVRDVNRNRTAGAHIRVQGDLRAGLAARRTTTAATGRAG